MRGSIPVQDEDEYLTQEKLAERLGKSEVTIYRWRVSHGLPYLKAGTDVLIRWSDFLEWSRRRAEGKGAPNSARSSRKGASR